MIQNLSPEAAAAITKNVQQDIGETVDGVPGPKTRAALAQIFAAALQTTPRPASGNILTGDGSFPYTVQIDGDDLVMSGYATCFGGPHDPQDDGHTASGFRTDLNPGCKVVSLAMVANLKALRGSPVPRMPFGMIYRNGAWVDNPDGAHAVVTVNGIDYGPYPVVDEGPGFNPPDHTPRVVDMTTVAAQEIDPKADPRNCMMKCRVRIPNGVRMASTPLV